MRYAGGFWLGTPPTDPPGGPYAAAAFAPSGLRRAWLLTAALAASVMLVIGVNFATNVWNRHFFDALEKRDGATLATALPLFGLVVLAAAGAGVLVVISRETLQVRWREWLTARLVSAWFGRGRIERLPRAGLEPANPEYRIADDARMATEPFVDFAIGLLSAVCTALAFVGVLWAVGGSLDVGGVRVPAYMVLAAVIYGVAASALMWLVGRRLVPAVAAKNEAEGRFRFALMRAREAALETGATGRREATADALYGTVVARWLVVVHEHGRLTWITNGNGVFVPVVPLLLAAPKYLSGELSLGAVTQLAAAFVQVQLAIAWLVDNFSRVADWLASARRVCELVDAHRALDARDEAERPEAERPAAERPSAEVVDALAHAAAAAPPARGLAAFETPRAAPSAALIGEPAP